MKVINGTVWRTYKVIVKAKSNVFVYTIDATDKKSAIEQVEDYFMDIALYDKEYTITAKEI